MDWKYDFIAHIVIHEIWNFVNWYIYDFEMELCPKLLGYEYTMI